MYEAMKERQAPSTFRMHPTLGKVATSIQELMHVRGEALRQGGAGRRSFQLWRSHMREWKALWGLGVL